MNIDILLKQLSGLQAYASRGRSMLLTVQNTVKEYAERIKELVMLR